MAFLLSNSNSFDKGPKYVHKKPSNPRKYLGKSRAPVSTIQVASNMPKNSRSGISAVDYLSQIAGLESNPMMDAIALDTEFIPLGKERITLQVGIAAQRQSYVQQVQMKGTQYYNEALGGIADTFSDKGTLGMKPPSAANIFFGIPESKAGQIRDIVAKVKDGTANKDETTAFLWLLQYKDMSPADVPDAVKKGLYNLPGMDIEEITRRVNRSNVDRYASYFDGSEGIIQKLVDVNKGLDRTAVQSHLKATVLGAFPKFKGSSAIQAGLVVQSMTAEDIYQFQDMAGLQRDSSGKNILRWLGMNNKKAPLILDTEAGADLISKGATKDFAGLSREVRALGGQNTNTAITDRLRRSLRMKKAGGGVAHKLASWDASNTLTNSYLISSLAYNNGTTASLATQDIGPNKLLVANSSFGVREDDIAKNALHHQVYTEEGWNKAKTGLKLSRGDYSESPLAIAKGDVFSILEYNAGTKKSADAGHYSVLLKNNTTNLISHTVFSDKSHLDSFMNSISHGKAADEASLRNAKLYRQAAARTEYAGMFNGNSAGWYKFDQYFSAFDDIETGIGKTFQKELANESTPATTRGIISDAMNILNDDGALASTLMKTDGLTDAERMIQSRFQAGTHGTGLLKTPNQKINLQFMLPELASKRTGLKQFWSSTKSQFSGTTWDSAESLRKSASAALSSMAEQYKSVFSGQVEEALDSRILNLPNIGRIDFASKDSIAKSLRAIVRDSKRHNRGSGAGAFGQDWLTLTDKLSNSGLLQESQVNQLGEFIRDIKENKFGAVGNSMAESLYGNFNTIMSDTGEDNAALRSSLMDIETSSRRAEVKYAMAGKAPDAAARETLGMDLIRSQKAWQGSIGPSGQMWNPDQAGPFRNLAEGFDESRNRVIDAITRNKDKLQMVKGENSLKDSLNDITGKFGSRRRKIHTKIDLKESGEMAIILTYNQRPNASQSTVEAMSRSVVLDIPAMNPKTGILTLNGTPLVSANNFTYSGGMLGFQNANDALLSVYGSKNFQNRISKALEAGDVATAQGIANQAKNQTLLNLQRYGGSVNEAYRGEAGLNPLQMFTKKNKIDYSNVIMGFMDENISKYDQLRDVGISKSDYAFVGSYLLRDKSTVQRMIQETTKKAGPMWAKKAGLMQVGLDIRKVFENTLGEEEATKLLKFGSVRADQTMSNFLYGMGPESMSVTGRVSAFGRSHLQQALSTNSISPNDYIRGGKKGQLIKRSDALGKTSGERFRDILLSKNAYQAYQEGKEGIRRGINLNVAYVDELTMQRILAPAVEAGHFNQFTMPSLREGAALFDSKTYEALQVINTRTVAGNAAQKDFLLSSLHCKNVDELQALIKKSQGGKFQARLWIDGDDVVTANSKRRRISMYDAQNRLGYKGRHSSQIVGFDLMPNGGYKMRVEEYSPNIKGSLLSGEKITSQVWNTTTKKKAFELAKTRGIIGQKLYDSLMDADLILAQETKSIAGYSETMLTKFIDDLRRSGMSPADIKDRVADVISREYSVTDPLSKIQSKIRMTGEAMPLSKIKSMIDVGANGEIVVDNVGLIKNTPAVWSGIDSDVTLGGVLREITAKAGLNNGAGESYVQALEGNRGFVLSGIGNYGVTANMYDYGGMSSLKTNIQILDTMNRQINTLFKIDSDEFKTAEKYILSPMQQKMLKLAGENTDEIAAVRSDISDLINLKTPGMTDNIIRTSKEAARDRIGKDLYLADLVTKRFGRSEREALINVRTPEEIIDTYYGMNQLKMVNGRMQATSEKFFVELPMPVNIMVGKESMGSTQYMPITFRKIGQDATGAWSPDKIQDLQSGMFELIDEYNRLDGTKNSITPEVFQRRAGSLLGQILDQQHNATAYRKGSLLGRVENYYEEVGTQLWASPTSILSSNKAWNTLGKDAQEGMVGAKNALAKSISGDADVFLSRSAAGNILSRAAEREGITLTEEAVEAGVERMTKGYASMIGRNPVKDIATDLLVKFKVQTSAEEEMAARAFGIPDGNGLINMPNALKRYREFSAGQALLEPILAKAELADYDLDAMIAKMMGVSFSKTGDAVIFDETQQTALRKLLPVYREFIDKAATGEGYGFVGKNKLLGDLNSDMMNKVMLDQYMTAASETQASMATVGKEYVGQIAGLTERPMKTTEQMLKAVGRLKNTEATSFVGELSSISNIWSSTMQQATISTKKLATGAAVEGIDGTGIDDMFLENLMDRIGQMNTGNISDDEFSAFTGQLQRIGFMDNDGFLSGRPGGVAGAELGRKVHATDFRDALKTINLFDGPSSYGDGRTYPNDPDDLKIKKYRKAAAATINTGSFEGTAKAAAYGVEGIENLDETAAKTFRVMGTKSVIDDAAQTAAGTRAKFANETIGGLGNILKSPNLGRVAIGAGAGLGALMLLGSLTAPGIEQTDDRSAVDRSITTEGNYLNPEAFAGAPMGAGPTMGLPPAYITPEGTGYNRVNINIRGRNSSGLSDSSTIQYIQNEINSQIPLQMQFNYNARDTRDHLDKNWLGSQINNIFDRGYST